jgi:hypothetical protein
MNVQLHHVLSDITGMSGLAILDAILSGERELFAAAFEERVLEFERLKERAAKGSYEKFRQVMAKVPPTEPAEHDRL